MASRRVRSLYSANCRMSSVEVSLSPVRAISMISPVTETMGASSGDVPSGKDSRTAPRRSVTIWRAW